MRKMSTTVKPRVRPATTVARHGNVILRPPTIGDLYLYSELNKDHDAVHATGCRVKTEDELMAELQSDIRGWEPPKVSRTWEFVIEANGLAIGTLTLYPNGSARYRAEFGISLLKEQRRKGYATDALRALVGFAEEQGIKRVVGRCFLDNAGCARTMQAAGFEYEGIERQGFHAHDTYHDALLYAYITGA